MKSNTVNIIGIILISVAVGLCWSIFQKDMLFSVVQPGYDLLLWMYRFEVTMFILIGLNLLLALAWYMFTEFSTVTSSESYNRKALWYVLALISILSCVIAIITVPNVYAGILESVAVLSLNGIISFYLPTLLFSPIGYGINVPGRKLLQSKKTNTSFFFLIVIGIYVAVNILLYIIAKGGF